MEIPKLGDTDGAIARFHLAFPVRDLAEARSFYAETLGCSEGRSSEAWVDFNLFGHQIVAHLAPQECKAVARNAVDDHAVPVRHFGLILEWPVWEELSQKLKAANVPFLIDPYLRFEGRPGEQGTFFIKDPSGNALEFKTFRNQRMIFETELLGD